MKSIKLRTSEIVRAFKVIDSAKYQKMGDDDKIRLWRISRKLGPVAENFSKEAADAQQKLLPSEDFQDRVQKALLYESMQKEGRKDLPMSDTEHSKVVVEFNRYKELVEKATKDLQDREETLEFEPLSEEAFGKLMASNDWEVGQLGLIDFIIG